MTRTQWVLGAVGALMVTAGSAQAMPVGAVPSFSSDSGVTTVQYWQHRHRGYPGEALDRIHHAPPGFYAHRRAVVYAERRHQGWHRWHHYGY